MAGLASIIKTHDVIYNSIFYNPRVSAVIPLTDTPLSLATYRQDMVMGADTDPPPAVVPAGAEPKP